MAFGEEEAGEEAGEREEEGSEDEEETTTLRRGTILRRCLGARVAVGEGMDELVGKIVDILFFKANYGSGDD